jgi:hypothetical protein
MKKIARAVFLTTVVALNASAFAPRAHATSWYVFSKTIDADGELMSTTCRSCWFWNCDC